MDLLTRQISGVPQILLQKQENPELKEFPAPLPISSVTLSVHSRAYNVYKSSDTFQIHIRKARRGPKTSFLILAAH